MTPKSSAIAPNYLPSYHRQWRWTLILALSLGAYYWIHTRLQGRRAEPPPSTANAASHDSYYVLRMPESQIDSDVQSARRHFAKWIEALEKEGFQFYLLSDVLTLVQQNKAIPDKAVVLVFDPGYHRTAQTFLPVLDSKKIPAVWLTNGEAIKHKDKRYVSPHVIQVMQKSGHWDVGFYTPDSPLTLRTRDNQTLVLGHPSPWKKVTGRIALNRGFPVDQFDRLHINGRWTEQDLVHRLMAERPIRGATFLSSQQIQGRDWGIALNTDSTHDTRFTVRAAAGKRSGSLYWLGTLGVQDVHLRMNVQSLVGEIRIFLRSDQTAGEDITVVVSPGRVSIDQTQNFQNQRLTSVVCPDIRSHNPFNLMLVLKGRELAVAVNNHPVLAYTSLALPKSDRGLIRLMVQDSLQGVAEARSVQILCTPLEAK